MQKVAWTHFLLPSKSLMLCVLLLLCSDDVQHSMRHVGYFIWTTTPQVSGLVGAVTAKQCGATSYAAEKSEFPQLNNLWLESHTHVQRLTLQEKASGSVGPVPGYG